MKGHPDHEGNEAADTCATWAQNGGAKGEQVSTDFGRSFVSYTSLVHAQPALQSVGVYVSASRLYNEYYDAHCRHIGIKTPQRRVRLAPRVIIRKLH